MLNKKLERNASISDAVDIFQNGKHICRFDWSLVEEVSSPKHYPSTEDVIDLFLTSSEKSISKRRKESCSKARVVTLKKGDAICFGEHTPKGSSCHRVSSGHGSKRFSLIQIVGLEKESLTT